MSTSIDLQKIAMQHYWGWTIGQLAMYHDEITVTMERVPDGDGPEFDAWCKRWGCRPLGSDRRAWCVKFNTYLRDAIGVAYTESGESFLLYPEDLDNERTT